MASKSESIKNKGDEMLEDFLKTLGTLTGKTFTPAEFGELVEEARKALRDKKKAEKASESEESDSEKQQNEDN